MIAANRRKCINWQSPQSRGLQVCWRADAFASGVAISDLVAGRLLTFRNRDGFGLESPIWSSTGADFGIQTTATGGPFGYQYLTSPSAALYDSPDLTVACWVRPDTPAAPGGNFIVGKVTADYAYCTFGLNYGAGAPDYVQFFCTNGAGNYKVASLAAANSLVLGRSNLLIGTIGGGIITIYANGRYTNAVATGTQDAVADELRFSSTALYSHTELALSEFRFYNRALSASEAWALYDPATRYELYQQPRSFYGKAAATPTGSRRGDFNISLGAV